MSTGVALSCGGSRSTCGGWSTRLSFSPQCEMLRLGNRTCWSCRVGARPRWFCGGRSTGGGLCFACQSLSEAGPRGGLSTRVPLFRGSRSTCGAIVALAVV